MNTIKEIEIRTANVNDTYKRCMARTARMVIKESGEEGKLKLGNCNIAMEMHKYIGKTHAKRD